MRELFILIAHLLATLAKLARPGGLGKMAAESLAVKHQLLIMRRARRRVLKLTAWDRLVLGICALFVAPKRLSKLAVIVQPSTLLGFPPDRVSSAGVILVVGIKHPKSINDFDRLYGEIRKSETGWRSELDLNFRDPSLSLLCRSQAF